MSGAGWSVTKHASKPASSATRAHSITAPPVTNSAAWATWSVGNPIVKRIRRILRNDPCELAPLKQTFAATGAQVRVRRYVAAHDHSLLRARRRPRDDRGRARGRRRLRQPGPLVGPQPARQRLRAGRVRPPRRDPGAG